jgi:hypothetical protein
MRTMPLVISPWSNTARHKGFTKGRADANGPSVLFTTLSDITNVISRWWWLLVVVVPLVASVVKRILWGGAAAIDQ